MGFSRNFKGISLQKDGSLLVEGINNTSDDVREEDITELGIVLMTRPDLDDFVVALADLPLTGNRWDVAIPDPPAVFQRKGQSVLAIGFVKLLDAEGRQSQVMWGADVTIDAPETDD